MTRPRTVPMAVTLAPDRAVTSDEVHDVAVHGHRLLVSAERLERVQLASSVVERALARGRKIYGLNTYVGHLRDREVKQEALIDYQHQLLAMHARGIGDPLPVHDVRALMLVRIVGMSHGGSGAHPTSSRCSSSSSTRASIPSCPRAGRSAPPT